MIYISDSKSGKNWPHVVIGKIPIGIECLCFIKGELNTHRKVLVL